VKEAKEKEKREAKKAKEAEKRAKKKAEEKAKQDVEKEKQVEAPLEEEEPGSPEIWVKPKRAKKQEKSKEP